MHVQLWRHLERFPLWRSGQCAVSWFPLITWHGMRAGAEESRGAKHAQRDSPRGVRREGPPCYLHSLESSTRHSVK